MAWTQLTKEEKKAKLAEYCEKFEFVFHKQLKEWDTFLSWFMAFEHLDVTILENLNKRLQEDRNHDGYLVMPPTEDLWTFTRFFDIDETKAVILLQDPYPKRGKDHGLGCSVREEWEKNEWYREEIDGETREYKLVKNPYDKIPKTLRCVYDALRQEYPQEKAFKKENIKHLGLEGWANQKVAILDCCLTHFNIPYSAQGHRRNRYENPNGIGWEYLIEALIKHILSLKKPVVYMAWGHLSKQLMAKTSLGLSQISFSGEILKQEYLYLPYHHPCNDDWLSKTSQFTAANKHFVDHKMCPINWTLMGNQDGSRFSLKKPLTQKDKETQTAIEMKLENETTPTKRPVSVDKGDPDEQSPSPAKMSFKKDLTESIKNAH